MTNIRRMAIIEASAKVHALRLELQQCEKALDLLIAGRDPILAGFQADEAEDEPPENELNIVDKIISMNRRLQS